ncbi:hypothetical protein ACMFMG_002675 [Clarireedia jacksonii]
MIYTTGSHFCKGKVVRVQLHGRWPYAEVSSYSDPPPISLTSVSPYDHQLNILLLTGWFVGAGVDTRSPGAAQFHIYKGKVLLARWIGEKGLLGICTLCHR